MAEVRRRQSPNVDVRETEREYVLSVDAPGVNLVLRVAKPAEAQPESPADEKEPERDSAPRPEVAGQDSDAASSPDPRIAGETSPDTDELQEPV